MYPCRVGLWRPAASPALTIRGAPFVSVNHPLPPGPYWESSSLNPSTYGQAVTFTAAVTSSVGAPPDGEAFPHTDLDRMSHGNDWAHGFMRGMGMRHDG